MSATTPNRKGAISRRSFLNITWKALLAATGLLALGDLLRFWDYQDTPASPTEFDLGAADQYALGSWTPILTVQAILIHDQGGFIAFSTACPHLGCTLEITSHKFVCPCHRSHFDSTGKVMKGPATHNMTALRVEQAPGGNLILHLS